MSELPSLSLASENRVDGGTSGKVGEAVSRLHCPDKFQGFKLVRTVHCSLPKPELVMIQISSDLAALEEGIN